MSSKLLAPLAVAVAGFMLIGKKAGASSSSSSAQPAGDPAGEANYFSQVGAEGPASPAYALDLASQSDYFAQSGAEGPRLPDDLAGASTTGEISPSTGNG